MFGTNWRSMSIDTYTQIAMQKYKEPFVRSRILGADRTSCWTGQQLQFFIMDWMLVFFSSHFVDNCRIVSFTDTR